MTISCQRRSSCFDNFPNVSCVFVFVHTVITMFPLLFFTLVVSFSCDFLYVIHLSHYRQHTTQHNTRFSPVFRTWCSSDTPKHERGTTPLPSAGPDPLHSKWRAVWELTKAHALWRCVALRVAVAAATACWMRVAVAFRCRLVCFVCALPSPPGGLRVCQVHVGRQEDKTNAQWNRKPNCSGPILKL